MHTGVSHPPGHPHAEPSVNSKTAPASSPIIPPTPLRCEASDRLVALTTSSVLTVPRQHDDLVVVPLGAILSPTPSKALPTYAIDPATCTNCGAYINVYAPASGDRGEWHCNFCLHLNSGGSSSNHDGILAEPQQQQQQQQQQAPSPLTSPTNGLSLGPHSYITPPTMPTLGPALGGSGSLPSTPLTPLQPPLMQEAVDYISPANPQGLATAGPPSAWPLPAGDNSAAKGLTILVIDLNASPGDLQVVKDALLHAAEALPGTAYVALVACGTAVQVYRLGVPQEGAVQCDVLPGDVRSGEMLLSTLRPGVHVSRAGECRPGLRAAIASLRPHPIRRPAPRCIFGGVEAALHLCQLPYPPQSAQPSPDQQQPPCRDQIGDPGRMHSASSSSQQGGSQPAERQPVALGGPQLQCMDRAEAGRPPGHVVLITTGRAAQGYSPQQLKQPPGSQEEDRAGDAQQQTPLDAPRAAREVSVLADTAALQGVTIDVLSAGVDPDHIPGLSPLAQGTAGLFVRHRLCDESFSANVSGAVCRPAGLSASLEVRTSSGLAVRDTYGAVVPLFAAGRPTEQWQALTGGASPSPHRWLNRRTWHYRCAPPTDSGGVTLVLNCDKPPAQTYVYIQVVWSWVGEGGHRVLRIVTRRLRTTHNPTAVVEAVDAQVAAVVWAKMVVAQALEAGAAFERKETEIVRRQLGKKLAGFVSRFGFPEEGSRGWFSGPSRFVLPDTFLPIAQTLYCLQRGPMLHYALGGHPEDRSLLQGHFMTASLQLSALMCIPTLHLLPHLPPPPSLAGEKPPPPPQQEEPAAEAAATELHPPPAGAASIRGPGSLSPSRIRMGSGGASSSAASLSWRTSFVGAPPVDLALHDSAAAVLDHGSHMFVWINPGLSREEVEVAEGVCRQYALELGTGRVPVPETVVDSTQCILHLAPIREDTHRQQLQQAPFLAASSRALLEEAARKLGPTGDRSFFQWLLELGVQLPQEQLPAES